jgi:TolA-binding protein
MKKSVLALFLLLAGPLAAEWTLKDWLKDLDSRVRRTEQKRQNHLVAAASVRGAKQEGDAKKVYWKGRQGAGAVTAEELEAFKAAVALAREGKADEAKVSLEAFMSKFAASPLKEDAQKTLALLKEGAGESRPGK